MKGRKLGGEGKVAEIDGGYFGGYREAREPRENRVDRRLARNQTGKRKVVVIIRERNGRSLPAVFRTEGQALSFIRSRIAKGTIVNADEAQLLGCAARPLRNEARSITKKPIASTALARIGRRNISAACAAPKSAIIIISPGLSASLRARGVMARGSSPDQQWRSDEPDRWPRHAQGRLARFHRVLAATQLQYNQRLTSFVKTY